MTTKELVKVVNKMNRVYNGIRPEKIVEVSVDNLPIYLDAWFVLYKQPDTSAKDPDNQGNSMTIKELTSELEALWFTDTKGMKRLELLAKYEELSAKDPDNQDSDGEEGTDEDPE